MTERTRLIFVFVLQFVGALFFAGQILLALFGISMRPMPWQLYELLEIISAIALATGSIAVAVLFQRSIQQRKRAQQAFQGASSSFHDLLEVRFSEWGLTNAERDVALFAIKGMNTSEIAALRNKTEGTIKAQSASIYKKVGVNSRSQLVSTLVEEFFDNNSAP